MTKSTKSTKRLLQTAPNKLKAKQNDNSAEKILQVSKLATKKIDSLSQQTRGIKARVFARPVVSSLVIAATACAIGAGIVANHFANQRGE